VANTALKPGTLERSRPRSLPFHSPQRPTVAHHGCHVDALIVLQL
jgi:hypothetical protein